MATDPRHSRPSPGVIANEPYDTDWDGALITAVKHGARVQLLSHDATDLTAQYPHVAAAIANLKPAHIVLEGELLASPIAYHAFDLIELNHESWADRPFELRRQQLASILSGSSIKLAAGPHPSGPHSPWPDASNIRPGARVDQRVSAGPCQEFVVGGFTMAGQTFESLLVGYYTEAGALLCAGAVSAGFTPHQRSEIVRRLGPPSRGISPFVNLQPKGDQYSTAYWVWPKVVIEVAFVEWTRDGLLRHPTFIGIRDDRPAANVRRQPLIRS